MERGAIHYKQAYAQGKMLDHSAWSGVLPRRITPSDIDMTFDNAGEIIFVEVSSHFSHWIDVSAGQRLNYWNVIRGTKHIAVLAKHSVPSSRAINTLTDISAFCVMWDDGSQQPHYRAFAANSTWRNMVSLWFRRGAATVRNKLTAKDTHA